MGTARTGGLVEVVILFRILVALDQERVKAGAVRTAIATGVDVPQQLAVVRVVHVHRPQQLEHGGRALRENVDLDRGHVVVQRVRRKFASA